jgi:hypothetical protein
MTSDEFFKRILDPNAGYKCVAEQEARDRQRWERNALKQTRVIDAKLTSKASSVAIAQ